MQRTLPTLGLLVLVTGISIALGCQSPRSSSYYVLVSIPPSAAPGGDASQGPLLVVDPVVLPGYLERPQLVSRGDPGELNLSHDERWSEDLSQNVSRVLADDLAERIPSDRVGVLQPGSPQRGGTRLRVEISRFERSADGGVELVARWSLRQQDESEPHVTRRSTFRVATEGSGTADTVRAMSQALAHLADEIRRAL